MKVSNTAERIQMLMRERNLRQTDILEMCKPFCEKYGVKMGKNDISQYVSGRVEPGSKKLAILGLVLNVDEVWLMGYDVPMRRREVESVETSDEMRLLQLYRLLNDEGKKSLLKQAELHAKDEEYTIQANSSPLSENPAM